MNIADNDSPKTGRDDGPRDDGPRDDGPRDDGPRDDEHDFASSMTWPLAIWLIIAAAFASGAAVYVWDNRAEQPSAVDIGFADDMSSHHNQAIRMSITYLTEGRTPFLRHMAEEILIYQIGEVRDMQAALTDWGESGADTDAMAWMGMAVDEYRQPGMATDDELAALEVDRGRDLDDLFTRLMIRHHAGGGHMARYAIEHARIGRIRELAKVMAAGQAAEVTELGNWRTQQGFAVVDTSDLPQ